MAALQEQNAIHEATCRARRQNLLCGTCSQLAERAVVVQQQRAA